MLGRSWLMLLGALPVGAAAQMPVDFEAVELARSRACVGVLARVAALDVELGPLAERSQRLLAIGQAVALEEREVMDSLSASDALEVEVHAWFVMDGELAQQYVASPSPALVERRSAARDSIQAVIQRELETIQARADSLIATTGTLGTEAGNCSGVVLIRPAVLETCASAESPVCEAARDTTEVDFRFVPSAEILWGLQELRAWTAPGPLQVMSNGQLGGARSVGFTRAANIVVTLAFGPRLRRRADLTPAEAARASSLADSLGFGAAHADVVFTPSLAVQATLPAPIGGETRYVLHFGSPEEADILWAGDAGTGAPLEGVVDLGPARLMRLQASEPLTLTALRATGDGANDPVYSIELTSLNQGPTSRALVAYMTAQLGTDLARLFPTQPTRPPPPPAPR
jgi:hypothetical protein